MLKCSRKWRKVRCGYSAVNFDQIESDQEEFSLTNQDQDPLSGSLANNETNDNQKAALSGKRKFVEPEISQPVDVLEATTFFQAVDSGPSN